MSGSETLPLSQGTYDYLERRLDEAQTKSVSYVSNPVAGRLTLVYYIQGLQGPEKVEREFCGQPGGALRECNALGEWKEVYEGLGSEGYTVSIGTNETLKGVVQHEFKTFKRRDKTSGNPRLVSNMGRPKTVAGKNVNTYLDNISLATAQAIGAGNTSEGIRQALALPSSLVAILAEQQKAHEDMQAMIEKLSPGPAFVEAMERAHSLAQEMEKNLAPFWQQPQVATAEDFKRQLLERSRDVGRPLTQPQDHKQKMLDARARRGRPTIQDDLDRLSNPRGKR